MSTNSAQWTGLAYNHSGRDVVVGTIHHEFKALEILSKSPIKEILWHDKC